MEGITMRYGLLKSGLDAHTLGLSHLSQLLNSCGIASIIADAKICDAVDEIEVPDKYALLRKWLCDNRITHLGFSYRLDPSQAVRTFLRLMERLSQDDDLSRETELRHFYFAGLPESCRLIRDEFQDRIPTFEGDETPIETLRRLGVAEKLIPKTMRENSAYDDIRMQFGKELISSELPASLKVPLPYAYPAFGSSRDRLVSRLEAAREKRRLPLLRVHVGPYDPDRAEALAQFSDWLKRLSKGRFLDIVSVGSSQLSQSHFGEDWANLQNGGGVPFNSEFELRAIREDASPMLVRAYSGTKNIARMAEILEKNLNMAWHALSFWWFNRIDGRGPLSVRQGLKEHVEAISAIARHNKPFEPNIPHHFAFRGSDDVSYVVSAYVAAKTARSLGIRHLILQNMLNTPRSTWGLRDLAKSRVMLKLLRSLESSRFRVIYQPRAGLDFFSPDLEKAKRQLAAVTALMQDVEPENPESPQIIHVVSFSEARFLADPAVIDESLRITRASLAEYPGFRRRYNLTDFINGREVHQQTEELWQDALHMIRDMERNIPDLTTPDGLYRIFHAGYFPVPFLWEGRDEFPHAVSWSTGLKDGGVHVLTADGGKMKMRQRLERIHAALEHPPE